METKRAILYARVSSDDTKKDGRNLRGQLDMCREHAHAQGWSIIAELAEDERGASGVQPDLPKLTEILRLAERREFDVLIVRELDRLSRSLAKQLFIENFLLRTGVQIEYVLGEYPDTSEGGFIKNIRAAVAELERLKLKERITRGKLQAVKSGSILVNNRPPYGYDIEKIDRIFKLRVREDEARIIRLIFEWYTQGDENGIKLSVPAIAQRLTQMNVPTYAESRIKYKGKVTFPGRWHANSVRKMLSNTVYKGQWRYQKKCKIDGRTVDTKSDEQLSVDVPAIVDEATWDAAQTRPKWNGQRLPPLHQSRFLLTSYIWCDMCGAKVHGRSRQSGKYRHYICDARERPQAYLQTCTAPEVASELVEVVVWEWLSSRMSDPKLWAQSNLMRQNHWNETAASIYRHLMQTDKQVALYERQQKRLLDLYLNSSLSKKVWEKRSKIFRARLSQLNRQQAKLKAELEGMHVREEQIQDIHEQCKRILDRMSLEGLQDALKRQMFDLLNVRMRLGVEAEGQQFVLVICLLGEEKLALSNKSKFSKRKRQA